MKYFKQILCLLLAASLFLLAACSGNNANEAEPAQNEAKEGRYVETDITPPIDGRFMSFQSADGALVCFDEGLKTRYESVDGQSWSQAPGPGAATDCYFEIESGAMLPDGGLLAFMQGEGLMKISPDGSATPYPMREIDEAIASGESTMISTLQYLGGDRLLISYVIGGMFMRTERSAGGPASDEQSQEAAQSAEPSMESAQGGPEPANPAQGGPEPANPAQGGPESAGPAQGGPEPANPVQGGPEPGQATQGIAAPESEESGPNTQQGQAGSRPGGGAAMGAMQSKTALLSLSSGQIIAEPSAQNIAAAAADASDFYLMDTNGTVTRYSLDDGAPIADAKISFGGESREGGMIAIANMSGGALAIGVEGGLYAAWEGSVLLADASANVSTVLESTAYSIGAPRSSVSAIHALSGGIVANVLEGSRANRLYQYVWDENAAINPDKTITVWSLADNNLVRAAIAQLRKAHPDSSITYEIAMEEDSAISAADAIKALNTRLLSGSGPDVILLDGCPVENYAGKGMLLDLTSLLDTGDVYENLLAPYQTDSGALYCLPAQFLVPALIADADALSKASTLDELVALAVNGNDLPAAMNGPGAGPLSGIPEQERSALYFNDLRELCKVLWLSSASAIVSDNKLNTDALRAYLEAVKAVSDKYALTERRSGRGGMSLSFSDGGVATQLPGSLTRYVAQYTNYAAFTAGNLSVLEMVSSRSGSQIALFPGLTPGAWEPSCVAGISADTSSPEFAKELVQAMLSLPLQQLNYGTGMPVTKAGMQAQIDAINDRLLENDEDPFALDIDALVGQLQAPSMGDTALTDMMWVTVEKCCKGEIDVEGAVREIEQNIKNYLAERS